MSRFLRHFSSQSPFFPYIVVVMSMGLALVVRQVLDPVLGDRQPFGVFFIAVMAIAWQTGIKPTLLALLLGSLMAFYLFVQPRNTFAFSHASDLLGWIIFFVIGLSTAVISEARRKAQRKAEANAQEVQVTLQRLTQEINQHRRTLEAFQNKDKELRDVIENAIMPMHWADEDDRIIWANQAEFDLLGYAPEEYIGQPVANFHVDQASVNDILQRLARDEAVRNYEARLRCKDGSIKHVLVNSSVYKENGRFVHSRCFTHDITERKMAEETQARLSAIVEYSADAIVSKTLDSTIVSWNAGAREIFGYSAEEVVGKSIRILFPPERMQEEDEFIQQLSKGKHIQHYETVRVRKDGQRIDISVTLSPIHDAAGNVIGVSKIARNISERKLHERNITLLLELSTAFSQAITPEQIAEVVVEQALNALGAVISTVCLLVKQGSMLELLSSHGLSQGAVEQYHRTSLSFAGPLNDAVRTDSIIWIESFDDYVARYPHLEEAIRRNGSRSTVSIPLKVNRKVIGGFTLSFPFEKPRNAANENFFITLAHMCAQALERTRLYEAERQERNLAEALRDTAVALSNTWESSEVFEQILNNIGQVIHHDMADIMLIKDGIATIVRSRHYAKHKVVAYEEEMQSFSLSISDTPNLKWVIDHKQFCIIEDTQATHDWIKMYDPDIIRSTVTAPILIDGSTLGFLNVSSLKPNFYLTKDGKRLQSFANLAAVAIRNAHLYQQGMEMAALEERHRIARDLHDAVSQTLFSANIIAESLPRTWELQPEKALAQVQLLHQLTRGAAAEMRVLLVELRPESLTNSRLKDLLTQLGYALPGRKNIDLSLLVQDLSNQPLPPEVQITFYRVAQESLNNVIKHGQATQVRIRLLQTDGQVMLTIIDNGQGFDMKRISRGIGLNSMQERASSIQASLNLKSTVGRGTRVRLMWPSP